MKQLFLILLLFWMPGFLIAQATENNDVYYNLAHKLYDEALKAETLNNTSDAIKTLEQAVSLAPDFEKAYLKLGELKIKSSQVQSAITNLDKAIQLKPSEKAYLLRSQAFLLNGDLQNSYNDLVKILSASDFSQVDLEKRQLIKDLATELYRQAEIDLAKGMTDAAIQKFNQIIIIDPQNVDAYFQKGLVFFKNQEYSTAIIAFDRVIEIKPFADAYYYRGASRYKLKNVNGAFDDISQAIADRKNIGIDGSDKIIKSLGAELLAQAVSERKKGNYATANELLQKSILLNPEVGQIYFEKGLFELRKNEFRLAIDNFNKAYNLSISDETLFYRGIAYLENNETYNAFNDLSKFFNTQPTFIDSKEYNRILEKLATALQTEAKVQHQQGRVDEATRTYTNLLQLQPNNVEAYKDRAGIFIGQKKYQEAINDLDHLVRIQPSNEVYFLRGRCYLELNNVDAAVKDLVKTLNNEGGWIAMPDSDVVYDHLAGILFDKGVEQFQKGNYSVAKDKFSLVQLLNPDVVQAYLYQGLIFYHENQYRQAIANFDKILSVQPSSEAYLYRAKSQIALNDFDEAYNDLGQINQSELSKSSQLEYERTMVQLADSFYEEGLSFEKSGRIREAQQRFNQVIKLKPNHAGAHFWKGNIYLKQKQYLDAISAFNKAIELNPTKEAYFGRGAAKSEINDLSGAFDDLTKAKSLESEKTKNTNSGATVPARSENNVTFQPVNEQELTNSYQKKIGEADRLYNQKEFLSAITAYSEASLIDPSQTYPRDRIREIEGLLTLQTQTSGETKTDSQTVIEDLPGNNFSRTTSSNASVELYNEGLERYYESDMNGALEKFTEAIKLDSSFTDAYYNSGFIKLNQGDYEEAIADFDLVISISPTDKAYFYKGRALLGMNRLEDAVEQFTNAINLNNQFFYAFNNRGNVRFQLGDYQGAIDDFTETLTINTDYVFAYNNRGNARFKLNDYNGAIADYNIAINLRPDYGFAYLNRGIARELLGDMEGACADWKLAAELGIQIGQVYYEEQCETKE